MKKYIALSIVALVALTFLLGGWCTVPTGYVGVEMRMGAVTGRIMSEGFSTKTPLIVSVKDIEIRIQKEQVETEGASKDLQTVKIVAALNYHPQKERVADLYKEVGEQYMVRIVDPAMQESVKAVLAQYTAEELISKRESKTQTNL